MAAKKKHVEVYAVIANKSYGLYVGLCIPEAAEPMPDGTLRVSVRECRHVPHWQGKTGGITSLAAHGLCGPRAAESRVGAPAPGVTVLTGVVNIFPCTPEARATLEAAKQS